MIDRKYWLSFDQIKSLSKEEAVEFYNAWANYWRYDIGINVIPAAWRIVDKEKKFIPIIPWKEWQDKPIPEKMHEEWLTNGSFVTGIAGIFGPVWHRPDKRGYFFGQVDVDNALAIKEIIAWKGDLDIPTFAKRTVVEQHEDNLENSMHVDLYSKTPLINKDSDTPKNDKDRPSFEVHCIGRVGIMSASKHKKGYPMMLLDSGATTEPMVSEDGNFEQYLNSICIKHGLRPYLNSGNGNDRWGNNNNDKNNMYSDHECGTPLSDEIIEMIRTKNLDAELEIHNGARHKTLLKIADSILFRYSEAESLTSLKDFFILVNEHYCKPTPLPTGERDQIWSDAVEYVSRKKAEQSNRILIVSEAIREKPGDGKVVRGTVVSVSSPFKVILRMLYRCLSCGVINEGRKIAGGPIIYPLLQLQKPAKCVNCEEKELEADDRFTEMDDAKIITLQNINLNNDLADEQLEVILFGDNTKYTRAGEVVTINGTIYHGISNNGLPSKARKTITLMRAKFVTYEDRRSFVITDKDIEAFHKFAAIGSNGDRTFKHTVKFGYLNKKRVFEIHDDVIDRLVSMTAPNVIGESDKKLGGLISIVGGVEETRRGRIHTLYVGGFGLAKSMIARELVKMALNSRFITIQHASSKSALGIVEKVNDTTTLVYGPIPLSNGGIVGLDELQTWNLDEQSSILQIMEEGNFYLLKYAKNRPIEARVTIIATVNPQDIIYKNRTTIAKDEITLYKPLLDRFDQIFVFLDNRTEDEDRAFATRRGEDIKRKRQHNYNFISKYLMYAKTIQPQFTPESQAMLTEFWITLRKEKKPGVSNRTLEAIFRMAEGMAKLRLKTVIDVSIASEVEEKFMIMLSQQGQFVRTIEDPRVIAVDEMMELVRNSQAPISCSELIKKVCKLNPFINSWVFHDTNIDTIGDLSTITADNHRYRELHDRFFQRIQQPGSKIMITSFNPLVVVWQTSKAPNTIIDEKSEVDQLDQLDKGSSSEIKKSVAESGEETTHVAESSPNETLEPISEIGSHKSPNPDPNFFASNKESLSSSSSSSSRARPAYEYLDQVDAYRCNWCKCVYYADTKDTNAAHPCNLRGREPV